MKKHPVFFTLFLFISGIALGQNQFKEINWKEAGIKFKVPSFIEINSSDDESIELESEDFLIYLDLVDEFDTLDELLTYYKIKKNIEVDRNINTKTFTGETASGFIKLISEGDDLNMYNLFGNFKSKLDHKKVAFDLSTYEYNDDIEAQINEILSSIQFY